jgi:hypothetical protein
MGYKTNKSIMENLSGYSAGYFWYKENPHKPSPQITLVDCAGSYTE